MNDRELLEAAAKAAGISGAYRRFWWNPLKDDGDALRLAVKLGISVIQQVYAGEVYTIGMTDTGRIEAGEPRHGTEQDYAATRRAIVRAAAASLSPEKQENQHG